MESTFQENEIVWAKLNGFPSWPAYVKAEVKPSQFEVVFFGDFSRAILHKSKVMGFEELCHKSNSKNKVLNTALRSAVRVFNGEATLMEEWCKIDKSILAKYAQEPTRPRKKSTKPVNTEEREEAVCPSQQSKDNVQEVITKLEIEEQADFKCSNSGNNNLTSSTFNHIIDFKGLNTEMVTAEEQLEELWMHLRNESYKMEIGIAIVSELTAKILASDPKSVFASNIGSIMVSFANICKLKALDDRYRLTFDALASSINQVCDYIVNEGFLIKSKVLNDFTDLSKQNPIMTDFYPEHSLQPLLESTMSSDAKPTISEPAFTIESEHTVDTAGIEIDDKVQFRVKRKIAKLLFGKENPQAVSKRVCEEIAKNFEEVIRKGIKTEAEYKERVLGIVKVLDKEAKKVRDVLLRYQSGRKIDVVVKEINKLTMY